jgi:hypothetical protein
MRPSGSQLGPELRHRSNLLGSCHVIVISKLLSHSSIAVTPRCLDHLTDDRAVAALEAVDLPPLGQKRNDPARRR